MLVSKSLVEVWGDSHCSLQLPRSSLICSPLAPPTHTPTNTTLAAIVNSLTPLVAPFVQNMVLKTPIPKGLLLSVFVTTIGCVLVGVGQTPYVLGGAARWTYR
jgi:hypothetical protein